MDAKYRFYSQCLFRTDDETLEQAAEHKLESMWNGLQLEPGMRLLDIGGGWGGVHEYCGPRGVDVTSLTHRAGLVCVHYRARPAARPRPVRGAARGLPRPRPRRAVRRRGDLRRHRAHSVLPALLREAVGLPQTGRPALPRRVGQHREVRRERFHPPLHLARRALVPVPARHRAGAAVSRPGHRRDEERKPRIRAHDAALGGAVRGQSRGGRGNLGRRDLSHLAAVLVDRKLRLPRRLAAGVPPRRRAACRARAAARRVQARASSSCAA